MLHVKDDADRWRSAENMHSMHYVTMGDAIQGCQVNIPTINGTKQIEIEPLNQASVIKLEGQGL